MKTALDRHHDGSYGQDWVKYIKIYLFFVQNQQLQCKIRRYIAKLSLHGVGVVVVALELVAV